MEAAFYFISVKIQSQFYFIHHGAVIGVSEREAFTFW